MGRSSKAIFNSRPATIKKTTTIQGFTPEEELKYLVERGDWELVLTSQAFLIRSPEGQAQVVREAIDNRISQLGKTLYYLVNRGPNERAAAMGVLQRKRELEKIRDTILRRIYEQYPRVIPSKSGVKIDF